MPTVRQPPSSAVDSVRALGSPRETRYNNFDDGELVKRAIKGNRNAFNELVERYHVAARKKAYAILKAHRRVDMFLWFLLQDETLLGGWQSGLVTATGKKKPSFPAFRKLG